MSLNRYQGFDSSCGSKFTLPFFLFNRFNLNLSLNSHSFDNPDKMNDIQIYKSANAEIEIKVQFDNDTVWLSQSQITELFQRDRTVITKHINKIFKENELDEKSNVQKMHIANSDKPITFYNLDVVISVGYRVNSKQGTQFRQWATFGSIESNRKCH